MLLINLLSRRVRDTNTLYLELCKNKSGFGHYLIPKKPLFKKKKERLPLLSEALEIDDKKQIIVNINPQKLIDLASFFAKKEKYNKQALCLALICADNLFPRKDEAIYCNALVELDRLVSEGRLKNKELMSTVKHRCLTCDEPPASSPKNKAAQKVEEIKTPSSIQKPSTPKLALQQNKEIKSDSSTPSQSTPIQAPQKSEEIKNPNDISLSPQQNPIVEEKTIVAEVKKITPPQRASLKPLSPPEIVNDKTNEAKQKIMPSLSRIEFQKIINSYQSTSLLCYFSFINPIRSIAIKEFQNLLDKNKDTTVFFKKDIEDVLRLESNRRQTLFAVGNSKDANKTSTDEIILQLREKFITRL